MTMKQLRVKYLVLIIAQMLLWNFCNFTPLLVLTFMPVMVLFLPVRRSTPAAMATAFAIGFAVDFLTGTPLGLSSLALVPVALVRRPLMGAVFGPELLERSEEMDFRRYGLGKMAFAALLATALFLIVFIIGDSAGTVPAGVSVAKGFISLLVDWGISLPVAGLLCPDPNSKWK